MLKSVRFQNWRSLRDVSLELTPITVLIGANSSGKTNIIDALKFERDSYTEGVLDAVMALSYDRIPSIKADSDITGLHFTVNNLPPINQDVTKATLLRFDKRTVPFWVKTSTIENGKELEDSEFEMMPLKDEGKTRNIPHPKNHKRAREIGEFFSRYIMRRWQILSENFLPRTEMGGREGGDRYVVEPDGRNIPLILELIQESFPEIYEQLNEDIHYVLEHVGEMRIWRQEEKHDLKILIAEPVLSRTAPTISAGTVRAIAILVALHALDMPQKVRPSSFPPRDEGLIPSSFPGLIVIEEPDSALNPSVLERLVHVIRRFTENPDKPRQVILTTHNPTFLSYFKPEEVRVVERDEQGDTHIYPIRPDILDDLETFKSLGEVWLTGALGGLAE